MSQKSTNINRRIRAMKGSSIVEGTCGIALLGAIAIPFMIFFSNMVAQLILQAKVAHVANQAAQAVDDSRYWLGMPRPGFNATVASEKASDVATELCKQLGLGSASVTVTFDSKNADYDLTTCDVNANAVAKIPFRVKVFGFDMAKLFPGNVSARGVACHAKIKPYALIHMDAPHSIDESTRRPLGFNQRDVAVIPAYGFFYTAVAGETTNPTGYGNGLAKNLTPENSFSMNHYHLKQSDVRHVLDTAEDVQLSSWHKERLINEKKVIF